MPNLITLCVNMQGYIFWPFLSKVKGKNLKEDLKKGKEKGGKEEKKKRVIKHT